MKLQNMLNGSVLWLIALTLGSCTLEPAADPLPSWQAGGARHAIIEFVEAVTDASNADFVDADARVAVFDNDGTLWSEQPLYFQYYFMMTRVHELLPEHPEWEQQEPFATVLRGKRDEILALGIEDIVELILATHTGMTNTDFRQSVVNWIDSAEHPTRHRPFPRLAYQPMLELMRYLRRNDFAVYIVSGGSVEFLRVLATDIYGVPPENVVGTDIGMRYVEIKNQPALQRLATVSFVNDGAGKPVGIQRAIGRRPIFAFGNSDGDFDMLRWTSSGKGRTFGGLVHHTDSEREWAYDRDSPIGELDKALQAAEKNHWTVVDMKSQWRVIYPPQ